MLDRDFPPAPARRGFLSVAAAVAGLLAAGTRAADAPAKDPTLWNADAFSADRIPDALRALGVSVTEQSERLQLSVPELAEDGSVVSVQVLCLDFARAIHILVDKNPFALNASFFFPDGTEPFVSTRIRMAETSSVIALAVVEDRVYVASERVKVTIGGCGG